MNGILTANAHLTASTCRVNANVIRTSVQTWKLRVGIRTSQHTKLFSNIHCGNCDIYCRSLSPSSKIPSTESFSRRRVFNGAAAAAISWVEAWKVAMVSVVVVMLVPRCLVASASDHCSDGLKRSHHVEDHASASSFRNYYMLAHAPVVCYLDVSSTLGFRPSPKNREVAAF